MAGTRTVHRAFKYRIYPTHAQDAAMQHILGRCRELYNAALEERREAWRMRHQRINYYDQARQLPAIKEVRPEYRLLDAQMVRDVLKRVDLAFAGFFRRVRAGHKAGYPRFRGRARYDSFTFQQNGWKVNDGRLHLRAIGALKVRWHRPLEGTVKTVTVRRSADQWYVCFSCLVDISVQEAPDLPAIGIDVGLEHFATLSTGEHIPNPRHFRRAEATIARRQHAVARKARGSNNSLRARTLVAKAHRKTRDQRRDFHHKVACDLIARAGALAVERLQVHNMVRRPAPRQDDEGCYLPNGASAKGGLNKSIHDAGWAQFLTILTYKAADAGRVVVAVNPAGTSQECSGCGASVPKDLDERWHSCACGTSIQRDHNSARTMLIRAGLARVGVP
jgi:putative transposase